MDFFSIAEPILIICGGLFIAQLIKTIFDFLEDIREERINMKEILELLKQSDEIYSEITPENAIKFLEREKTIVIDKDFFELINKIGKNDTEREIFLIMDKQNKAKNVYIDMAIKALEEQEESQNE